jgi:hypothetical protein
MTSRTSRARFAAQFGFFFSLPRLSAHFALQYFQKDEQASKNCKGTIGLKEVSTISPSNYKNKQFCLAITTPKRIYYLVAENNADMQSWKEAIQAAVDKLNGKAAAPAPVVVRTILRSLPTSHANQTFPHRLPLPPLLLLEQPPQLSRLLVPVRTSPLPLPPLPPLPSLHSLMLNLKPSPPQPQPPLLHQSPLPLQQLLPPL